MVFGPLLSILSHLRPDLSPLTTNLSPLTLNLSSQTPVLLLLLLLLLHPGELWRDLEREFPHSSVPPHDAMTLPQL